MLLTEEVQNWLFENIGRDSRDVSLEKSIFKNISSSELAGQLKGLQIAKHKFRFLFESRQIYYPPSVHLEQSSSQATAEYKSNLVSGKLLIDLTTGMGTDAYFFSKNFDKVIAIERNSELTEISKYNYKRLGCSNLEYLNSDFSEFLNQNPDLKPDLIYLDPSRRNSSGRKFLIEELEPDLNVWMDRFIQNSDKVMVKLSPLSDLSSLIERFHQITEIHLVAVKNEMKELLLVCEINSNQNPKIKAVNLESAQADFEFNFNDEKTAGSQFSDPEKYIYEPNSAVMKSGGFKLIGQKFNLNKLEKNTHLYTSDLLAKEFPGRIYQVLEDIKDLKKGISNKAFHLISRNYPIPAEEIRKKYRLKQSEEESLIFTKSISGKKVLRSKILNFDNENH